MSQYNDVKFHIESVKILSHKADCMVNYAKNCISNHKLVLEDDSEEYSYMFCVNSSLHRGYFHPSPVYDLIIGNTRRGRFVRNGENYSHRYVLDNVGKLKYVESYRNGRISYVEHLQYDESTIIGITIDQKGRLAAVCEETYIDSKISSFILVNCLFNEGNYVIFNIRAENFYYDSKGLSECAFRSISPSSGFQINKHYAFERKDGFLVSYTDTLDCPTNDTKKTFQIAKRRKA